jgi:acetolactate synthase regulatory subunit
MPRQGRQRSSVARAREERAQRILAQVQPRGEHVLRLDVWLNDNGQVDVKVDSDRDPEQVAALLEVVAEQIQPPRDRADEVGAWGADRRRRT